MTKLLIILQHHIHFAGTDLKNEIECLQRAMHRDFTTKKQAPIFNPAQFRRFCRENGAPTIFGNFHRAMTDTRHSEERRKLNEDKVVESLYKLCYGRSKRCNHFQKAHGIYLKMNHVSYEGIRMLSAEKVRGQIQ